MPSKYDGSMDKEVVIKAAGQVFDGVVGQRGALSELRKRQKIDGSVRPFVKEQENKAITEFNQKMQEKWTLIVESEAYKGANGSAEDFLRQIKEEFVSNPDLGAAISGESFRLAADAVCGSGALVRPSAGGVEATPSQTGLNMKVETSLKVPGRATTIDLKVEADTRDPKIRIDAAVRFMAIQAAASSSEDVQGISKTDAKFIHEFMAGQASEGDAQSVTNPVGAGRGIKELSVAQQLIKETGGDLITKILGADKLSDGTPAKDSFYSDIDKGRYKGAMESFNVRLPDQIGPVLSREDLVNTTAKLAVELVKKEKPE